MKNFIFPLPKVVKERSSGKYFSLGRLNFFFERNKRLEDLIKKISEENSLTSQMFNTSLKVIIGENKRLIRVKNKEEAYFLRIKKDLVEVNALTEKGAFYALQTLRQLLKVSNNKLREMDIIDWPDLKFRGVHLTLGSGHMPNFDRMKYLIERFAYYKINYLIFEYDDRFPWEKHKKLVHPLTYSKSEIEQLVRFAKENFIEVIPLIDSLGHAEHYLKHEEYSHLRELPDRIEEMCPSNPATLKFIKELWEEVLEIHKDSKYAHITGDEVFRLGSFCEKCMKYAKAGKLAELYRKYYTKLSRWIIKKGKIPMMWGDILIKYPEDIENFPKDITICDWCYLGIDKPYWDFPFYLSSPKNRKIFEKYLVNSQQKYMPFPYVDFFKDNGFEVIGSTSSSQSSSQYPLPSFSRTFANNKRFSIRVNKSNALGILITNWTSSSSIEANFYGILAGADFSWHVRDEEESIFAKRFVKNFLFVSGNYSKYIMKLDKILYDPIGFEPFKCSERRLREIREIFDNFENLESCDAYTEILKWVAKASFLHKKALSVFGKINHLLFEGGKDIPLKIEDYTNYNFEDFTDWPITITPGVKKVYEVPFKIINPKTHRKGKSLLVVEKPIKLKINKKINRLFFLYTGYYIERGKKLAEIEIIFKNGKKAKESIISGKNVSDWWRIPYVLSKAVPAWEGKVKIEKNIYLYISYWKNPSPEEEIDFLNIFPKDKKGRLLVFGITARVEENRDRKIEEIENLKKELEKIRQESRYTERELFKIYRKLMGREDIKEATKRIIPNHIRLWINKYMEFLNKLERKTI